MLQKFNLGKKSFFLGVLFLSIFFSCQKESLEEKTTNSVENKQTELKKGIIHCSPYRNLSMANVSFGSDLATVVASELTTVTNCMENNVCQYKTSTVLQTILYDNSGNSYFVSDGSSVSISDQNSIMQSAKNYANSHVPAGYYMDKITYIADHATCVNCSNLSRFLIKVTYSKCTGAPTE